ncbi:MAG: Uncharacterised protein [Flavobacteriia bacterium]|nr:MAG: Uncharacterised protein [Flavobacteriia bacterium]
MCHDHLHSLVDAALEIHRIGASRNVLQTLIHDGLGKNGCCGGSVTGYIRRFGGHFFDHLCPQIFDLVFEFDLFGHTDTVFCDGGTAKGFFDDHIASLWTQRDFDRIGQRVNTSLEAVARFNIKMDFFCHFLSFLRLMFG